MKTTLANLYRNAADCLEMAEAAGIAPQRCVKTNGQVAEFWPKFNGHTIKYEFAIGIVEGTPIFTDSELYLRGNLVKVADILNPSFGEDWSWIAPVDPYAELKAAHAAGKKIQYKLQCTDWEPILNPCWALCPEQYRIAPVITMTFTDMFGHAEDGIYDISDSNSKCLVVNGKPFHIYQPKPLDKSWKTSTFTLADLA